MNHLLNLSWLFLYHYCIPYLIGVEKSLWKFHMPRVLSNINIISLHHFSASKHLTREYRKNDVRKYDALIGIIDTHNFPSLETYHNFVPESQPIVIVNIEGVSLTEFKKVCSINWHKIVLPCVTKEPVLLYDISKKNK